MAIVINRITNANVYMGGNNLIGRASEVQLPDVTQLMTDHEGLGMIGAIQLPAGFDNFEGSINWNSFYRDAFLQMADVTDMVQIQIRTSVEHWSSAGRDGSTPLVVHLSAIFGTLPLGTFQPRQPAEFASEFQAYYIKLDYDGETLLEVDKFANVYRTGGGDRLQQLRRHLSF